MRKHLLLFGALKDDDAQRRERATKPKHWDTHLMHDENEDGNMGTHGVNYVEQAVNEIFDWPDLLAADDDENSQTSRLL